MDAENNYILFFGQRNNSISVNIEKCTVHSSSILMDEQQMISTAI